MDTAKDKISSFLSGHGKHDTVVDENVKPAVTHETVKKHGHEEVTQAVDKEVHQDHYHTTVQPLKDQQVLPEKHSHRQEAVQTKEFGQREDHGQQLSNEAAKFRNTTTTHDPTFSQSKGGAQVGQHTHHHVHEQVQPVINKETIQKEVVHTTQPIHEIHHAPSEHHGMSMLPEKSLSEFKSSGASTGQQDRTHVETYEGDPRKYNPSLQVQQNDVDTNFSKHDGIHSHGGSSTGTSGEKTGSSTSGLNTGSSTFGRSGISTSGMTGSGTGHTSTSGTDTGSTAGTGTGSGVGVSSSTGVTGRNHH